MDRLKPYWSHFSLCWQITAHLADWQPVSWTTKPHYPFKVRICLIFWYKGVTSTNIKLNIFRWANGLVYVTYFPGAILEIGLTAGVIPLKVTPRQVLVTIFLSFYSRRVQKPLQRNWTTVFYTNLRLIHRVRLVWRHKMTNFLSKNSFVQVKGWSRDHCDP